MRVPAAPAEKIKDFDAKVYHTAAEILAAEMSEPSVFTNIPDHLVSAV